MELLLTGMGWGHCGDSVQSGAKVSLVSGDFRSLQVILAASQVTTGPRHGWNVALPPATAAAFQTARGRSSVASLSDALPRPRAAPR